MIRRMRGDRLPPPGEERGKLAEIVLKACSFDPKDRYASPKEMREALEELLWQAEHPNQSVKPPVEPSIPVQPEPAVEPTPKPDVPTEPDGTICLWNDEPKVPEKEVVPEQELESEDNETIFRWEEPQETSPIPEHQLIDEPEEDGTISLWGTIIGQRRRAKKVTQHKVDKAKERPKRVQEWYEREEREDQWDAWQTMIAIVITIALLCIAAIAWESLGDLSWL